MIKKTKKRIFQRKIKYRTEQQSSPNEMEKKAEAYTHTLTLEFNTQYGKIQKENRINKNISTRSPVVSKISAQMGRQSAFNRYLNSTTYTYIRIAKIHMDDDVFNKYSLEPSLNGVVFAQRRLSSFVMVLSNCT